MAEHPDVTLVKRGYAAFMIADVATLSQILAPDAVQHFPGEHQLAGDYKSRDEILAFYGRLAELTNGTYAVEPELFFTDGAGTVVVVHQIRGERGGKKLEGCEALIFRERFRLPRHQLPERPSLAQGRHVRLPEVRLLADFEGHEGSAGRIARGQDMLGGQQVSVEVEVHLDSPSLGSRPAVRRSPARRRCTCWCRNRRR